MSKPEHFRVLTHCLKCIYLKYTTELYSINVKKCALKGFKPKELDSIQWYCNDFKSKDE